MQRQTTWMVSILTLMVVLSAYYLMTGNTQQLTVTGETKEGQIETANLTDQSTEQTVGGADTTQTMEFSDAAEFFAQYKMQRNDLRSIEAQRYTNIIADANSSSEQIAEAQQKLQELQELTYTESVLEDVLAGDYGEAMVISQGGFVKVVVQAKELSKQEVVKIINLVVEQMAVPAHTVKVSGIK